MVFLWCLINLKLILDMCVQFMMCDMCVVCERDTSGLLG